MGQAPVGCQTRSYPERLLDLLDAGGERVDVVAAVIEIDAGTGRGRDVEALHQRLRAVMPRADGDALRVKDLGDVVRVDALDVEAEDARPVGRLGAVLGDVLDAVQHVVGIRGEGVLMRLDRVEADVLQVCGSRAEGDRLSDRGRPRLELPGE